MSSQHYQESGGYAAPQQADPSTPIQLGSGTHVMSEPTNPVSGSAQGPHPASAGNSNPPAAGSRDPPVSPMYDTQTPANATAYSQNPTGNFPTAQMPQSFSSSQPQAAAASQQPSAQTTSHSPYVQTTSIPGSTGKTPMDSIMSVFNKWSKKAEDMTGNYWAHLKTGPNVADTAMGRIALGTRAFSEGGLENVYRQTFEVGPEEHLLKTYACYLSTSTGPVAGTLYISTSKLAFCSDRPLAIPQSPDAAGQPAAGDASAPAASKKLSSAQQQQQQQQNQYCYYKVMIPISQVESVNPSENTQKKPPEKYVQVKTSDGHEFWFMGFVNYDKGVKNLQEAVSSKQTAGPTHDTTSVYADPNAATNPSSHANTNPTTNAPSYGDATQGNPTAYGDTRPTSHQPGYGTNPSGYDNTSRQSGYGDDRATAHPPSYNDTSYAADSKPGTGPPSYDDTSRPGAGPPIYDDANPTANPPSHVNTTSQT